MCKDSKHTQEPGRDRSYRQPRFFQLQAGETLGWVGDSGCGKTATMLSVLRLIASPLGTITSRKAFFVDQDLLELDPRMRGEG